MSEARERDVAPAFYARPRFLSARTTQWWVLLHPPYTLWHLSYVAIGAALAPEFSPIRLAITLAAFFFAVGLAAHALDELHDRPLRTSISDRSLVGVATAGMVIAVALGGLGVREDGPGLMVFIVVGVLLNVGYNLELLGGRLHNDLAFGLAWGSFPVLTAYYAQSGTLGPAAWLAAGFALWLSLAQRALSTQARGLRRRVAAVAGSLEHVDGTTEPITRGGLLTPIEVALKTLTWSVIALALAMVVARLG